MKPNRSAIRRLRVRCATLVSKLMMLSRSPRKLMYDVPGRSGPALPSTRMEISCQFLP
jgi:hypothetical protein